MDSSGSSLLRRRRSRRSSAARGLILRSGFDADEVAAALISLVTVISVLVKISAGIPLASCGFVFAVDAAADQAFLGRFPVFGRDGVPTLLPFGLLSWPTGRLHKVGILLRHAPGYLFEVVF
jgi:hypothetical protein